MKQNNSSDVITKDFFQKTLEKFAQAIRNEINFAVDNAADRLEKQMNRSSNTILTTVDPLLKELEDRREDREIGAKQTHELREKIEAHAIRLTKLERKLPKKPKIN